MGLGTPVKTIRDYIAEPSDAVQEAIDASIVRANLATDEFTLATVTTTSFASSSRKAITVSGCLTAGDGGDCIIKQVALEPSHAGKVQSLDGKWWEITDNVIRLEMFGGGNGLDDSAAFAAALTVKRPIQLLDKTYRCIDVVVPSFSVIFGSAPYYRRLQGNGPRLIPSGPGTSIFNVDGALFLSFNGFTIDGIDNSVDGISAGADNVRMFEMNIANCGVGYGSTAGGYCSTSKLHECEFKTNTIAIRNLVDSQVIGGLIGASIGNGISLSAGANDNYFGGIKAEFNGGYNIRASGADHNVFNLGVVDRGGTGGISLDNCKDTQVTGIFRRNGKNGGSASNDRCHVYYKNCDGLTINIQTEVGGEDDGSGLVSPQYSVRAEGVNTNITLLGDITGCVGTTPYTEENFSPKSTMLANGLTTYQFNGMTVSDGRVYKNLSKFPNTATAGSAVRTLSLAPIDTQSRRSGKMIITARQVTTPFTTYAAEIPFVLSRETGGASITLGTASNFVGSAIGSGTGTIALSVSNVATDGSTFDLTMANTTGASVGVYYEVT